MRNIENPNWLVFKGVLFLVLGIFASSILVYIAPRFDIAILLVIAIWAFCRFYYFTFYVIENYIDANHKFDGLYATFLYLIRRTKTARHQTDRKR